MFGEVDADFPEFSRDILDIGDKLIKIRERHKFGPEPFSTVVTSELDRWYADGGQFNRGVTS